MSAFFANKTTVLLNDFEHLGNRKFRVNPNKLTLRGFLSLRKVGIETDVEDLEVAANGRLLPAEKLNSFLSDIMGKHHEKLVLYVQLKGYHEAQMRMLKEKYKRAKREAEYKKMVESFANDYTEAFDQLIKAASLLKKPKITNCKNCGAPLHGNKCEYCDTEY